MRLKGKVAIVTGGASGFGEGIVRRFAAEGAKVVIADLNDDAAQKIAREIDGLAVQTDVSKAADVKALAEAAVARFGDIDILVNNAGIAAQGDSLPSNVSLDAIERDFRVNFLGSVAITQAMLPLLRRASSARIVNVSSGLGSLTKSGDPAWTHVAAKYLGYAASKAALNMLTVQLAWELRDTSIKVNSVDPGYTATDLNQHRGTQSIPEGAVEIVRLALLPDDGPTGTFSNAQGIVPW